MTQYRQLNFSTILQVLLSTILGAGQYVIGWMLAILFRPGLPLILLATTALGFMGCSSSSLYNPNKKFAANELRQDFDIAWKTYQKIHPSLYWYNSKDTVDFYFNETYQQLTDSLTEAAFRNKLAFAIEKIKCGHSSVRLSKAFAKFNRTRINEPVFPLAFKTWGGDSLVITRNAFRNDTDLVRGTVVTAINGKITKDIITTICQYISTDGLNNNFKYQIISISFSTYYQYAFGLDKVFDITYIDKNGLAATKQISSYNLKTDTGLIQLYRSRAALPSPTKKQIKKASLLATRNLTIDMANKMAVMQLSSFSKNKLPQFFRQSFRQLKALQIPNLVIELRDNGGGNISNSTRLSQYITHHPFKVADTVAAIGFNYPYPRRVKHGFWYKVEHVLVSLNHKKDGRYHFRQLEQKVYKPTTKNHYDGQVFIITGGFTFSASTLFINAVKGQKNVTIVGEETGGGAYGNTAVNIPDVVLPNTGLQLRLPLYRVVINKNLPHDGRGILPDILVPPSSWHLRYNMDPKMEKVKQLISRN